MKTSFILLLLFASLAATNQDLFWQEMTDRIDQIAQKHDGLMGISIIDLTDHRSFNRNADQTFVTASSIKLCLLLELYRQEQRGRAGEKGVARLQDLYTFDPKDLVDDSHIMAGLTAGVTRITNRDLAQFVVAVSDNAATNVLIDRVGMSNVNRMFQQLGIEGIQLRRKMMDIEAAKKGNENIATPAAMAQLLRKVFEGTVLNKELTDDYFKLMATTKDSFLPRNLPPDVKVANKPGELDGVRNDCGIVFAKNRPFVIVVMTSYDRNEREAESAIADVSLAAYQYFEMIGKTSEYGRIMNP